MSGPFFDNLRRGVRSSSRSVIRAKRWTRRRRIGSRRGRARKHLEAEAMIRMAHWKMTVTVVPRYSPARRPPTSCESRSPSRRRCSTGKRLARRVPTFVSSAKCTLPSTRRSRQISGSPISPSRRASRDGRVEFSSDLYLLRPLDASKDNGTAFLEISNRGRKAPATSSGAVLLALQSATEAPNLLAINIGHARPGPVPVQFQRRRIAPTRHDAHRPRYLARVVM